MNLVKLVLDEKRNKPFAKFSPDQKPVEVNTSYVEGPRLIKSYIALGTKEFPYSVDQIFDGQRKQFEEAFLDSQQFRNELHRQKPQDANAYWAYELGLHSANGNMDEISVTVAVQFYKIKKKRVHRKI